MIAGVAGVLLGLAGSAHCAAMCGPLALLVDGAPAGAGGGRWRRRAAYHAGRVATYALLGAGAGLAGSVLTHAGLGRALALVAGLSLVGLACLDLRARRTGGESLGWVTRALGRAGAGLRRRAIAHPAALGMLNGLLPCGLVYAALTAAVGTGSMAAGMAVMLGFGLGSAPALLGAAALASGASRGAGVRRVIAPVATGVGGVILILQALAPAAHDHHAAGVVAAPATAAAAPLTPAHRHP